MPAEGPLPPRRTVLRRAAWWGTGLALGAALVIGLQRSGPPPEGPAAVPPAATPAERSTPSWTPPGPGFVVWESNRGGRWRLWIRQLDGSGLRQLTADERRRSHCCPHISPDGAWIAYLSLPAGPPGYPDIESGVLHLIHPDGSGDLVLAPAARTYGEHRAAIWHDAGHLAYLDAAGRGVRVPVPRGTPVEVLTRRGHPTLGWLVGPRCAYATTGYPTFSPYDPDRRTVAELQPLPGCQPYFSADGRWGYWVAGAGGPIDKIDLDSRVVSELLAKNDERMPDGRGYLYFPMLSPDARLLAFAASAGEHDHFRADYDVYLVETDPERLALVGRPVAFTHDGATDRFPAPYLAPLPLGVHDGEAPFGVTLAAGEGGVWEWSTGDGAAVSGERLTHTYTRPGSYAVTARRDGRQLLGRVRVTPAAPPQVEAVEVRDARRVVVRFDEPIDLSGATAAFTSGRAVAALDPAGEAALVVEAAAPLPEADGLRLAGVADRAQRPNLLPPQELPLLTARWPADRRRLLFLWQDGDSPNRVADPAGGAERSFPVVSRGPARLDHAFRMDLAAGGFFEAAAEAAETVSREVQRRNEVTVELTLSPADADAGGPILALSGGRPRHRNLVLTAAGAALELTLLVGGAGGVEQQTIRLGEVPAGPHHLAVTYSPGRLVAYLDGAPFYRGSEVIGDFNPWRPEPLRFGAEADAEARWAGRLEGIAFYARELAADEVAEDARRFLDRLRRRPAVPRRTLTTRLVARSPVPTLEAISPYREALAVYEHAVVDATPGDAAGEHLRVAHWVLRDGAELAAGRWREGDVVELTVEPWADNPQLEGAYLSDTLAAAPELPLYYAVRP